MNYSRYDKSTLMNFPSKIYHWYTLSFILAFSFLWPSCTTTNQFKTLKLDEAAVHQIDSICIANLQNEHYPGLAISVISGDQTQWSRGYGYANKELKQAVNPSAHLFRIGSISKTVTAAALGRLMDKNQVGLDVPIGHYMPDLPSDKKEITLRQLGGHLAGIRHYKGIEFLSNIRYESVDEAMEVFIHDELLYPPGTEYTYSTHGWTVVSAVMEEAADKSILEIIEDEVSEPLRLGDLKGDHVDSIHFNRVEFYEFQDGKGFESPDVDLSNKWSGGGLLCSAEDLARFGFALADPGYIEATSLEEITKSQMLPDKSKTNYGIGVRSGKDDNEKRWFGHSGGSIGGTSMLLIYPDENLVIVTLVNLSGAKMNDLAWKIADVFREANKK